MPESTDLDAVTPSDRPIDRQLDPSATLEVSGEGLGHQASDPQVSNERLHHLPSEKLGQGIMVATDLSAEQDDASHGGLQRYSIDVTEAGDIQPVWRWPMIWIGLLLVCTNVGAGAFLWIRQLPKPVDCQQSASMASDRDHLVCANKRAQSGRLVDLLLAIDTVSSWPADHPLYPEAQRSIAQWSRSIMTHARNHLYRNNLQKAVMTANLIPPFSPLYPQAQSTIQVWRQDWDKGQSLYEQTLAAIRVKDWNQADRLTRNYRFVNNDYWQFRLSTTLQQLSLDEVDWKRLQTAKVIGTSEDPKRLIRAITTADQISRSGHIWPEAKVAIAQWSRKLLTIAIQKLQAGYYDDAISLATAIPSTSPIDQDVQQFLPIAKLLQSLESPMVTPSTLSMKIWQYGMTLKRAHRIPSDSPLYPVVTKHLPKLDQQFQDLLTLQTATLTSRIQHPIALEIATRQAKKIEPDHALRPVAQAQAARWSTETLRLQSRPYLAQAQRWSAQGTPATVQMAIAYASTIPPQHPLYAEAQADIRQYKARLEVLKDSSVLNQAKALAKDKQFSAAIATLDQVSPDRPLYQNAQDLRQDILTQQQIREDQPILEKATTLATAGNYTDAILLADQIDSSRALYFEAQNLVGRWLRERDGSPDSPRYSGN